MGVVKSRSIWYSLPIAGVSSLDTPARVSGSWRRLETQAACLGGCASRLRSSIPWRCTAPRAQARDTTHGEPLTTFVDQTTEIATTRPEPDTEATAADLASLELEVATDGLDLVAATAPEPTIAAARPAPATPAAAASD